MQARATLRFSSKLASGFLGAKNPNNPYKVLRRALVQICKVYDLDADPYNIEFVMDMIRDDDTGVFGTLYVELVDHGMEKLMSCKINLTPESFADKQ